MADRELGFRQAHAESGLDPLSVRSFACGTSFEEAYGCVKANIGSIRESGGLFALTDIMALGAMKALGEEGLSVPRDLSVVGYDDLEIGGYAMPSLTSVHQPREEIAQLACERLLGLLGSRASPDLVQRLIPPFLVRRESC